MTVLPDTNAITALRLGNTTVLHLFETSKRIFFSVIVLGELLYGYRRGSKKRANMKFLKSFMEKPTVEVLGVGEDTARVYAELYEKLRTMGKPIPVNDLWLASQALERGTLLLTNDAHFGPIIGLQRESF